MAKIIIIKRCDECPYSRWITTKLRECRKKLWTVISDYTSIPEWCPLKNLDKED